MTMTPKKIISITLATVLSFSAIGMVAPSGNMKVNAQNANTEFDENNIVTRFPVLSDTHVTTDTAESTLKFEKALTQLKENGNLDAIMFAGDITDYGQTPQIKLFSDILSSSLDLAKTRAVIAIGNHELFNHQINKEPFTALTDLKKFLGNNIYQGATSEDLKTGRYKTSVNGIDMIALNCFTYDGGVKFNKEDLTWLDKTLASSDKNKPVFISTHPMVKDTVIGSNYGAYWATTDDDLYNILAKYPNAVIFSGHLHFPINDEQDIWQKDFTAVGTGSVYYAGVEEENSDGLKYYGIKDSAPADAHEFSQGLLVEVDKNNNTRITRLDFFNKVQIKQPWYIPSPKSDKSHLANYNHETMKAQNKAPEFLSDAKITSGKDEKSKLDMLKVSFTTAKDDDEVKAYEISFFETGTDKPLKSILTYSDYYRHPNQKGGEKELSYSFHDKTLYPFSCEYPRDFYITVTAIDTFGAKSAPLKSEIHKGTGIEKPVIIPDKTVHKEWQYKKYTNFNTYTPGYTFTPNTDYNSWPSPTMPGSAQHLPMTTNGYKDSLGLTTKIVSESDYKDVIFTRPANGFQSNFEGAEEFWAWVDFSQVEFKKCAFGFRVGSEYGAEYTTDALNNDPSMKFFTQKDGSEEWEEKFFDNDGCMDLSGYKGFVRFDVSYFYENYPLYPDSLMAFTFWYTPKDKNQIGKTFTIDQVGFAGPEIKEADGTVEMLLDGEQFDVKKLKPTSTKPNTETTKPTVDKSNNKLNHIIGSIVLALIACFMGVLVIINGAGNKKLTPQIDDVNISVSESNSQNGNNDMNNQTDTE